MGRQEKRRAGHTVAATGAPAAAAWGAPAALTIAAAAALLAAVAAWNGWPLLYPDTFGYLRGGGHVLARFAAETITPGYGERSPIYGSLLLLTTAGGSPWGLVAAQATALAWTLWLSFRAIAGVAPAPFLALVAGLTCFTAAPWYVAFAVPDVFAPIVVLGLYLLALAPATLGRGERVALAALVALAIAVHTSHLALALALAAGAAALAPWSASGAGRRAGAAPPARRPGGAPPPALPAAAATLGDATSLGEAPMLGAAAARAAAGRALVPIGAAAILLLGTHALVYGRLTLVGPHPPFLLARVIADGPGARWVADACAAGRDLALCAFVDDLPRTPSRFLWGDASIMHRASPAERARIGAEEMTVVFGTLAAHPGPQLVAATKNWLHQLRSFGLVYFRGYPDVPTRAAKAFPAGGARYATTRQARGRLHLGAGSALHALVVALALAVGVALAWARRDRLPPGGLVLALFVALALLANAGVTGVLSTVADRYQGRVVWLVPWTVALLVLALRRARTEREPA